MRKTLETKDFWKGPKGDLLRDHFYENEPSAIPLSGFSRKAKKLASPLFLTLLSFCSPLQLDSATYTINSTSNSSAPSGTISDASATDQGSLNVTYTGESSGDSTTKLVFDPTGTLVVPGNVGTNFQGNTYFNSGIVQTSGTTNPFGTGNMILNGGTLDLAGSTIFPNALMVEANSTIQANGTSNTLSGAISSSSSSDVLTIAGSSNLIIPGTHTSGFTGTMKLESGTVKTSGTNPLGVGTVEFGGGALSLQATSSFSNTILFSTGTTISLSLPASTNTVSFTGPLTGTGALTFSGPGFMDVTANASTTWSGTGPFQQTGGTVQLSGTNPLGTIPYTFTSGNGIELTGNTTLPNAFNLSSVMPIQNDGGTSTISGVVTSTSGLTLTGTGTLTLSANNASTYTAGTTTLNGGTLQVSSPNNLGSSTTPTTVAFGGGTLELSGTGLTYQNPISATASPNIYLDTSTSNTWSGAITSSSAINLLGTGTLAFSGNNSTFSSGFSVGTATLAAATQNNLGSGPITLNGGGLNLTGTGTTSFTNSVTVGANGATFNSGGENTLSGTFKTTGGLTLSSGTLALTDIVSYSGPTTLDGGTLKISGIGTNPLGSSTDTLTFNGGILEVTGTGTGTYPNPITLSATNSSVAIDESSTVVALQGTISGTGDLVYSGAGTLQVTGNNSYSGGTSLTGGTLGTSGTNPLGTGTFTYTGGALTFIGNGTYSNPFSLPTSQTLTANPSTSSTITGTISGSGGLTVAGGGTLTLNPTSGSNTYGLGTTITGGSTVSVNSDKALGNTGTTPVTFSSGGGTLAFSTNISSARPITLTSNGTLQLGATGLSTLSNNITGSGNFTVTGAGSLALTGNNSSQTGTTFITGGATVEIGGPTNLGPNVNLNNGTLDLTGSNTYGQALALTGAGTLIGSTSNSTNIFTQSITGGNDLTLQGPGAFTLASTNAVSGITLEGETTLNSSTSTELGSGILTFGSLGTLDTGSTLNLTGNTTYNNHINFQSDGTISSKSGTNNIFNGLLDGPGSLNILGTGTVSLFGDNAYTGGTTLTGGTTRVSGTNPLGTGLLTFNGGTFELVGNSTFTGPVLLNSNGAFISPDSSTQSTFSGNISGTGTLTLVGPGTIAITGSNTYSGGTSLTEGVLQISGNSPIGTNSLIFSAGPGGTVEFIGNTSFNNAVMLVSNGVFQADSSNVNTLGGNLTGAGKLTKTGTGTLLLNGTSTYSGATTVSQGRLAVNGSITSPITVSTNGILSGSGKVASVDLYGTLSPGYPYGSLNTGGVTFESGSVFQPYLNGSSFSYLASSGNVSIEGGANLVPILNPYLTDSYTLIETGAGFVTGTFNFKNPGSARFPITLEYFPSSVVLTVQNLPFEDILPSGNLTKIAVCFDQLITELPSSEVNPITNILNGLSPTELASAFGQFDPSIYNVMAFAQQDVAEKVRAVYTQHAESRCLSPNYSWGVWGDTFAERVHQSAFTNNLSQGGYDDRFGGFIAGVDKIIQHYLVTTGFSYARSRLNWNEADARAIINSYTGLLGISWCGDSVDFDAYGSYTYNKTRGDKIIFIPPSSEVPTPTNTPFPIAVYNTPIDEKNHQESIAKTFLAHLGGTLRWPFEHPHLYFLYFGNMDYINVRQNPFQETGDGILNLSIRSKISDLLRPEFGIGTGFSGTLFSNEQIFGEVRLSYVREVRFAGKGTIGRFSEGERCSFEVYGLYPQQNLFSVATRMGISSSYGLDISLNFTGVFGSRYIETSGDVKLAFLF